MRQAELRHAQAVRQSEVAQTPQRGERVRLEGVADEGVAGQQGERRCGRSAAAQRHRRRRGKRGRRAGRAAKRRAEGAGSALGRMRAEGGGGCAWGLSSLRLFMAATWE